jgi:hypothetical protein
MPPIQIVVSGGFGIMKCPIIFKESNALDTHPIGD